MPQYDWTPSSNASVPTGEYSRAQSDNRPATAEYFEDNRSSYQSLPPPQEFSNNSLLPSESPTEEGTAFLSQTETAPQEFQCSECPRRFTKKHLLNKHFKKHDPPFKCTINSCTMSFSVRKDFKRHLSAIHPETVDELNVWYCPVTDCKFSSQQNGGSTRKDNIRRHINTQHREIDNQDEFMEE